MHVNNKYSWIKHIDFMALNVLALVISFFVSIYIRFGTLSILDSRWAALLAILILINIVITLAINPYSSILRRPYYVDVIKLFLLAAYSFVVVVAIFYLLKVGEFYSRIAFVLTFAIYYLLSLLFLCIRKRLILTGKIQLFNVRERKLVAVINYDGLDDVIKSIDSGDVKEYKIVGYCFPMGGCKEAEINGKVTVIKRVDLVDYVLNNHIDDVYISVAPGVFSSKDYKALVDNGVNVQFDIESMVGIQTDDQFISRVGAFPTLSVGPYAMDSGQAFYLIIKRGLDLILGLFGLVVLVPVTILVKAAYLLSGDAASIFYIRSRIGQYGKEFRMYKFRTMVPDADKMLEDLLDQEDYRTEWEKNQKIENDPRITPVGKFLRRTSLDEIPQVINILKGDMSVVGPRPLVKGELESHNGLTLYNKVRPGLTGWWACNGRSNISYKERLELEYYYVKNCSLQLDILCIARTIFAVLRRDGAQ